MSDPVFRERPRPGKPGRKSEPVALTDLMVPTLARLGLKTRARQVQVTLAWPKAVGAAVAAETTVTAFLRGRVTVETSSSALSHQLHLQSQTIIDNLNAALREEVVVELRFRLQASAPPPK
ncbi:MAG: DciA family protein [Candidatus Dormibacteria bacterium]